MKNVLLLVHEDAGEEARFQAALDLTRTLSGHLTCFDIVEFPPIVGVDPMLGFAGATILEDIRQDKAKNRRRIEQRLQTEDVPWNWIDGTGNIAHLLNTQSALADIIVLNTALARGDLPNMRATVSQVVMNSGKPILAVPQNVRSFDANGQVIIAWNGSTEAADTMRSVTPLLAKARAVTLVRFGEDEGLSIEEAAAYLSRHGIKVDVAIRRGKCDVADALIALCKEHQPNCCVMGAYSHGRIREGLFGGVTRRMLTDSPVPLLLGH